MTDVNRNLIGCGLAALLVLASASCRSDMQDQPRYEAFEENVNYSDSLGARPSPEGTVARGYLRDDEAMYTGMVSKVLLTNPPFPITKEILDRGQDRFNVFCSPCHGMSGLADGMIVRRGYRTPPSFHLDRLRTAPLGHFFDVMTNGFGVMSDYRYQLPARDRWAVTAYIRALQASYTASVTDVPGGAATIQNKTAQSAEHPGVTGPQHAPTSSQKSGE
jgi:hypothetical protein